MVFSSTHTYTHRDRIDDTINMDTLLWLQINKQNNKLIYKILLNSN